MRDAIENVAEKALALTGRFGAQEAKISVSRASHVELDRREGRLEKSSEAVTQGLTLTLMVDDRYSAHSTSDLREEAMEGFVGRAVAATKVLEPDPDYRQLPLEAMGHIPLSDLDLVDPSGSRDPESRGDAVAALETSVLEKKDPSLISKA